jgi:hypothetical protein
VTRELLQRLLAWWRTRERDEALFAIGFRYADHSASDSATVDEGVTWRVLVEQALARLDFRLIDLLVDGDRGVVVLEWTDPVTLLRHRTVWLVTGAAGQVKAVVNTTIIIAPAS